MLRCLRSLAVLLVLCLVASSAKAHFIWAEIKPAGGEKSQARFYFGEAPEPGEAHLIGKIAQTKAWVRTTDAAATDLKVVAGADEKAPALVAPCAAAAPASLEATCDYGVYERGPGVLLQYYAKSLSGDWAASGDKLTRAEKLALDIIPELSGDQLRLQVLYQGKPAAASEVVVIDPAGKSNSLKTDADGKVAAGTTVPGNYAIRAGYIEPQKSGEREGKKYAQTWHYTTLTMALPAAAPSKDAVAKEISASELLTRARAGRSLWEKFPGFTADITATGDGESYSGQATIAADGDVKLSGEASKFHDWIEEQLNSLVQHRMPDGEVSEGHISYSDQDTSHPLGRKIDLGDTNMKSMYRIKNDVIMEVNRTMGPKMRFTISVLEVEYNKQKKYLPRSFTMNFFDSASGNLKASHSYWNEWQNVGGFDLPKTIVDVGTAAGGTTTRQIKFENIKLLDPK